jgi:hypothetical protein
MQALDVFPKTLVEFRERTATGAAISLAAAALVLLLALVETANYATTSTNHRLSVDTSRDGRMAISANISFPKLPCAVLSANILDRLEHSEKGKQRLRLLRLDAHGAVIEPAATEHGGSPRRRMLSGTADAAHHRAGSAKLPTLAIDRLKEQEDPLSKIFAALVSESKLQRAELEKQLREHAAELKQHLGEGCRVEAAASTQRAPGSIKFSLTHEDRHVLKSVFGDVQQLDVSHVIHHLSFGAHYPGLINPLDGMSKHLGDGIVMQYHIKVVPATFQSLGGSRIVTNQYTFTEISRSARQADELPSVHFIYEISPIMSRSIEERKPLSSYLTQLCAIIGGVFAVAGILDTCLYRLSKPGSALKR